MSGPTLNRAERRRLRSVNSAAHMWLGEGDLRFFARHPSRRNRVRWAGPAEIAQVTECDVPTLLRALPGYRLATVVRLVEPGIMVRSLYPALAEGVLDLSESDAAQIFDLVFMGQSADVDLLTRAVREELDAGGAA